MKKLVIFDLDGTLVDSEDFIVWSFIEAGRVLGIKLDPSIIYDSIGLPLESVIERILINSDVSESTVEKFIEIRRRIVQENWRRMVKLFPDVKPALRELKEMGFSIAVASSSIVERIIDFLEYFGIIEYFTYISGMRPGLRGKPEPDVILAVLEKTGFKPSDAVYVGDREVDCVAASNAGVDFILINRKQFKQVNLKCKPIETIGSLMLLSSILKHL